MNDLQTAHVRCPYGEGQYYGHAVEPPIGFPCSGIQPGHDHTIGFVIWLRWLTEQVECLAEAIDDE